MIPLESLEIPKDLEVIPSIAVMGTTPVKVDRGSYVPITYNNDTANTLLLASSLMETHRTVHYLDILGIRKGKAEWNLLQALSDLEGEVWADVGVVYSDTLIDALMAGAAKGIVTTKMIYSLDEIVSSFELTENLMIQIDFDQGLLSRDPSVRRMEPMEFVEEMVSFGMKEFISDDITKNRKVTSPAILDDIIDVIPEDGKLYIGVEKKEELEDISDRGANGGIISCSRFLGGIE